MLAGPPTACAAAVAPATRVVGATRKGGAPEQAERVLESAHPQRRVVRQPEAGREQLRRDRTVGEAVVIARRIGKVGLVDLGEVAVVRQAVAEHVFRAVRSRVSGHGDTGEQRGAECSRGDFAERGTRRSWCTRDGMDSRGGPLPMIQCLAPLFFYAVTARPSPRHLAVHAFRTAFIPLVRSIQATASIVYRASFLLAFSGLRCSDGLRGPGTPRKHDPSRL